MLTYHEVMTTKLGPLSTAAAKWDDMAGDFKDVADAYKQAVLPVPSDGGWLGLSAHAASGQVKATHGQLLAAETQAKAIASLLRDAKGQFTTLVKAVKDLVTAAKKDGMSIDSAGKAAYDFSKVDEDAKKDPDYDDFCRKRREAEAEWTRKIKNAVQAVDDADQGVKLALREAAGIKPHDDFLAGGHDFNAKAEEDIEVYEARKAKEYADRVLDGDKLDAKERAEWERLNRDNAHNKAFSQTFLNALGPEDTLKLGNKFNDLAYFDDKDHKKDYLTLEKGLADTIAGATRVPELRGPDGKKVAHGTKEYQEAFKEWLKKDDANFYNHWRHGLKKAGIEEYDLDVAAEKMGVGFKGHDQQVRGYQSLITLMKHGDAYSPQFLSDVTDDMIAAERKDRDIWDLYGKFDGNEDGWFANDPVDGALGIMSRNPEGSAVYLDPGTAAGKENFDYLLGKGEGSRDWGISDTSRWGGPGANIEMTSADVEDADSRKGLGDALTAAATGVDPHGSRPPGPTSHTEANNRVFVRALDLLSGQGDDMPASLRDDMAKIMTNHGHEVYVAMADESENRKPDHGPMLDRQQVMEMSKQISRSEHSYGLLHEGMNHAIVDDIHDDSRAPEDTLSSAGHAVGFMEEARYNALKGDKHDYTWDKAWSYHVSGGLLNFVPVYGDALQRGADVVTSAWILDEQQHEADKLTENNKETYRNRKNQLNAIAEEWYATNSDWADHHAGYSREEGIYRQIAGWANDGNDAFDGGDGDQ